MGGEYYDGFTVSLGDVVKYAYLADTYEGINADLLLLAIDETQDAVERLVKYGDRT